EWLNDSLNRISRPRSDWSNPTDQRPMVDLRQHHRGQREARVTRMYELVHGLFDVADWPGSGRGWSRNWITARQITSSTAITRTARPLGRSRNTKTSAASPTAAARRRPR